MSDPRQLGAVGRGGVMETEARWALEPVVVDHVHRFVRTGTDATGMAVTEADVVAYAELYS